MDVVEVKKREYDFYELLGKLLDSLKTPAVEDSCYYLFNQEQAAKVWQIVTLFYEGRHSMSVSFYYATENTIAFKVYGRQYQNMSYRKPTFEFLPEHDKRLRQLFVLNAAKATQKDIEFVKHYFDIQVKVA